MKRWQTTALGWAAALVVAAAVACKPKAPTAPAAEERAPSVPLVVRATSDSNGGRPLYLLVRRVTHKSFIEDDYSTVARLVVDLDDTVIEQIVVFPGQRYDIDLTVAKLPETIGVYGLFTKATGESWKVMFEETRKIEISVGKAAIEPVGGSTGGRR